jgi:putative tryptophan/tyrosine transport system substrate-binding protein
MKTATDANSSRIGVHRRGFLTVLAVATLFPLIGRAQQSPRLVGLLSSSTGPEANSAASAWITGFEGVLVSSGWRVGDDLVVDYRFGHGRADLMHEHAAGLALRRPDVLVGLSTPATLALRDASTETPIVFFPVTDPVGAGLVESLARPGGRITGFSLFETTIVEKWLDLLKQVVPGLARVGILFGPASTSGFIHRYLDAVQAPAEMLAVETVTLPVSEPSEIEPAIAGIAGPGHGLIVIPDALLASGNNRPLVIDAALRYNLPAIYGFDFYALEGGLMSYAGDLIALAGQAAGYVNRILRGADPAELPVRGPEALELVINTITADAMGLTIPAELLAIANRVIE